MQRNGLWGAIKYEYCMQIRRRALWLTLSGFVLALLALTVTTNTWRTYSHERTALLSFADVASLVMLLIPVAVGLLLADRLPRDRATKVTEVLESLPTSSAARLAGKYLGGTAATLTPVLLIYALGIGYVLTLRGHDIVAVPLALLPLIGIILPGCLFVAAFSIACPAVIWTPLYQLLFVGYWFWGNLLQLSALPTLNGTLITPDGDFMLVGFFHGDGAAVHQATIAQGVASVLALLGLSLLALAGARGYQRWRQQRA